MPCLLFLLLVFALPPGLRTKVICGAKDNVGLPKPEVYKAHINFPSLVDNVLAFQGKEVVFPCDYTISVESGHVDYNPLSLEWTSDTPTSEIQHIVTYEVGKKDERTKFTGSERYRRDENNLVVSHFKKEDAQRKCCKVILGYPYNIYSSHCVIPTLIVFPEGSLECVHQNTGRNIANNSALLIDDRDANLRAECFYHMVSPKLNLESLHSTGDKFEHLSGVSYKNAIRMKFQLYGLNISIDEPVTAARSYKIVATLPSTDAVVESFLFRVTYSHWNDHCLNVACNDRGVCHNSEDGYQCQCNEGIWGKDCQFPTENLNVTVPRVVVGKEGDTATLHCMFHVKGWEIGDWELRWYSVSEDNDKVLTMYNYRPNQWGHLFKYFEGYYRYHRVNISLQVNEFKSYDARIHCCEIRLQTPRISQSSCMEVKYLDFPPNALQCSRTYMNYFAGNIKNQSTYTVHTYHKNDKVTLRCTYTNVYPRHILEVYYGDGDSYWKRVAYKPATEATPGTTDDRFNMFIDFFKVLPETTNFKVIARSEETGAVSNSFHFTIPMAGGSLGTVVRCTPDEMTYCLNGGTCAALLYQDGWRDVYCKCNSAFEGDRCERLHTTPYILEDRDHWILADKGPEIQDCNAAEILQQACQNGGTCFVFVHETRILGCSCSYEYDGYFCERAYFSFGPPIPPPANDPGKHMSKAVNHSLPAAPAAFEPSSAGFKDLRYTVPIGVGLVTLMAAVTIGVIIKRMRSKKKDDCSEPLEVERK